MTSELQRLALQLVASLDQAPSTAAALHTKARQLRAEAASIPAQIPEYQFHLVHQQAVETMALLEAAAVACEHAAGKTVEAHQDGWDWANNLANGISPHTAPASAPAAAAPPGADEPVNEPDRGEAEGGEVLELSSSDPDHRGALNNPPANSTILVDGRFTYETDDLGRVIRASAQIDAIDRTYPRDANAQRTMEGKLPGDHAGHIFARLFQGPGGRINLTAMTGNTINQSQYKAIENKWAAAIKNGHPVDVEVEIAYSGSSKRADGFYVRWVINGERDEVPLENDPL